MNHTVIQRFDRISGASEPPAGPPLGQLLPVNTVAGWTGVALPAVRDVMPGPDGILFRALRGLGRYRRSLRARSMRAYRAAVVASAAGLALLLYLL